MQRRSTWWIDEAEAGAEQAEDRAGLGLAIAKEIIERFGGTIRIANSREPMGLIQTVTLPLARTGNAGDFPSQPEHAPMTSEAASKREAGGSGAGRGL